MDMPREPENYRPELEQILLHFPKKMVLNTKDVMEYTGRSRHWLENRGLLGEMTAVQLAMALTKLYEHSVKSRRKK